MEVDVAFLHKVGLEFVMVILGVGFTVIVKVVDEPVHPFATGVTVIVAVTALVPEFVAIKDGMSPLPLAASPIEVVLFVQLKVVLLTAPVNATGETGLPLQTV